MSGDAAPLEPSLQVLIEAAYRQALAHFEQEVASGERGARNELAAYRRRRRDCLSLLRLEKVPDEAHELAVRLLETHGLDPAPEQRVQFEFEVVRMLVRLYDGFIRRAEASPVHGNR